MKVPEKKQLLFPKPQECPPAFPVEQVSKHVVVDSIGTFYDVWDHNGEKVYTIKYHAVKND